MQIKIMYDEIIDNITLEKPTKIIDLIKNDDKRYVGCYVGTMLKDLNYTLTTDSEVKLLTLKDSDGCRIYEATLRFIVAMAISNIYPKARVEYNYSVSRSVFANVTGIGHAFTIENFNEVKKEVERIIKADYDLTFTSNLKDESIRLFSERNMHDKVRIIEKRKNNESHYYECNGYIDYMYLPLLSKTGDVAKYKLLFYAPGFLIMFPRYELGGEIPEFINEPVFQKTLKEANIWARISGCDTILDINDTASSNSKQFINVCEARHSRQLAQLGDKIEANCNNLRMILIAGPSSSGKTTFTSRLKVELLSRGIKPLMISMDDFYKVSDYPKDEFGKDDYEHIEAVDLKLFDETIFKLIQGEEVSLPEFDFVKKERRFNEPIKIQKNTPILIEGIHALNEKIAPSVPFDQKFKIFIAPLGQYKFDYHSPISLSDSRLIRRMVRDNYYRGTGCEKTIEMWDSVRRGEFKWIYPCQNNADFVFNSDLTYEICVLKKHALPILEAVDSNSKYFRVCRKLIRYLKLVEPIDDDWVPCNSILREFIGNSIFQK